MAYLVEVLIEAGLARVPTPHSAVTISARMGVGATLVLIVFTRQRLRSARERLQLVDHLKWPS